LAANGNPSLEELLFSAAKEIAIQDPFITKIGNRRFLRQTPTEDG